MNFAKFLKTPFLHNASGRLLLKGLVPEIYGYYLSVILWHPYLSQKINDQSFMVMILLMAFGFLVFSWGIKWEHLMKFDGQEFLRKRKESNYSEKWVLWKNYQNSKEAPLKVLHTWKKLLTARLQLYKRKFSEVGFPLVICQMCTLWGWTAASDDEGIYIIQRRIQNPPKHLRWSFLWKKLTAFKR